MPRLVLCAGMKSSGSTWLFNVVAAVLRRARGAGIAQFYAEDIADFPAFGGDVRGCVVKTHIPSPALQDRARADGNAIVLSVREPRDAIASLMSRFDQPFDGAAVAVFDCARQLAALRQAAPALILGYEDRFYDRDATIERVADALGLPLAPGDARAIYDGLTREKVNEELADLARRGVFAPSLDPNAFDPVTHWHPRHVGDLKIRKYAEWLSLEQQARVLDATRAYCEAFGYAADTDAVEPR